jgi:hypothetical protein
MRQILQRDTTTNARCTVEERRFQRRAQPLNATGLQPQWTSFADVTTNRVCPMSRILCETWDSTPPSLEEFSATTGKSTTSVLALAPAQETAACSTVEERRFSAASSP